MYRIICIGISDYYYYYWPRGICITHEAYRKTVYIYIYIYKNKNAKQHRKEWMRISGQVSTRGDTSIHSVVKTENHAFDNCVTFSLAIYMHNVTFSDIQYATQHNNLGDCKGFHAENPHACLFGRTLVIYIGFVFLQEFICLYILWLWFILCHTALVKHLLC